MRLKQRLIELPPGVDVVEFVQPVDWTWAVFNSEATPAHEEKMSSSLVEAWFLLIVVALSKVNVPR